MGVVGFRDTAFVVFCLAHLPFENGRYWAKFLAQHPHQMMHCFRSFARGAPCGLLPLQTGNTRMVTIARSPSAFVHASLILNGPEPNRQGPFVPSMQMDKRLSICMNFSMKDEYLCCELAIESKKGGSKKRKAGTKECFYSSVKAPQAGTLKLAWISD